RRGDHFEWRLTASTKAADELRRIKALIIEASVKREFSSGARTIRVSESSKSALAILSDARRARESLSPIEIFSNRLASASSAAILMSAGAPGVSDTFIRSNVNR